MNQLLKVHIALFIVTLLYSINYVVAKILTPAYILPFGVIIFRVWGACILFWLIHALTVKEKIRERKDFFYLAYCSIFGVIANQLLFFKGISITSSINASIIMVSSPIMVLIASVIILRERLSPQKILGVFLGCLGAFMLIGGVNFSFKGDQIWGDLFVLANASSYGFYLVIVKPLMKKYHPLTVVKWLFIFGAIGVLPFGLYDVVLIEWNTIPWYAYLILVYIVVGVTFLVYLLNTWSLGYVNATIVGYYIYLQPVLTSMIAVVSGREVLAWEKVAFSLLIFLGVYLVSKEKNTKIVKLAKN